MSKAMVRRFTILLAILVVNVLASTSITNGYPTTALQSRILFDASSWSWNALWIWAVICAMVPFWSNGIRRREIKSSMARHPAGKGL